MNCIIRNNVKKMSIKLTIILGIIICSLYIFLQYNKVEAATNTKVASNTEKKVTYLSDIPYDSPDISEKSVVGWSSITMDKNLETQYNNGLIALNVNENKKLFLKGVSAHANSLLIYDVSELVKQGYTKFSTYYGVDASRPATGNAVYFKFSTKNNANDEWNVILNRSEDKKGQSEAGYIEIDLTTGVKYIKLEAYGIRGITSAHACYGDAKFTKADYNESDTKADFILTIEEYDRILKQYYNANQYNITGDYELKLLQRYLVNNIGYDLFQSYVALSPDNYETVEWLMTDVENLRYYILGGTPTGGYFSSLNVLTRLYKAHGTDFNDTNQISTAGKTALQQRNLNWTTTKGNLYKRMAITISLTHSSKICLWMQPSAKENQSDALVRYEQYKKLYDEGKFKATDDVNITPWFESYTIEEMRYVMHVLLDDEEVIWLNEYTQSKIDAQPASAWGYLTPHPYMAYVWPNYGNDVYYAEENKDYFNEWFAVGDKKLWDYGITRGTKDYKLYKLWMNFRNKFGTGAVCGGISKTGHCIRGANAIPSAVIGQPGHAAIIYYTRNSSGQGYWAIDNDVSGWTRSEKGERLPLGWGNDSWSRGRWNVPYIALAQEALNDYNNFVKAEEILMLEDVYKDDKAKQEQIYREAIKVQSINLDAWIKLIKQYVEDETKTEAQYYTLSKEMMDKLKYFPFTMYDLANKIKPKFTSNEYKFKYQILETEILTEAKNYKPSAEESKVLLPALTRVLAISLLGETDTSLAKFSFDGADAGKIVLSSRFDGNGIRWDYSLDGKKKWNEVAFTDQEEHKLQLTPEQIASITAENNIYVHIVGVDYSEENIYEIDIEESAGLPSTLYANDLENRMVGTNLTVEWRYKETDQWTSYSKGSPDLTGDKTVQLRQSATGTRLAGQARTFTFTADNQPDTRKYIPVSHLSKQAVSTEATSHAGAGEYALDANYNTRWHSAWNGTDTQRYFIVKLDKPVYLSAVEFVPAGGGNGRIVKGEILGSMTGEEDSWVSLANNNDSPWSWPTQANTVESAKELTKSFEIAEENREKVQYVKIVATQTNGNWFAARAFNFFQDMTKVDTHPTAGVAYSTTESTSDPVIARLVNPSTEITITSDDGKDSYVFTENGEHLFTFVDNDGNEGSALAKVDWIDKKAPIVDVNYKLSDDKKLIAILDNINEDVYLLDNNNKKTNFIEVENGKITSITFLDEKEESYKVSELDDNKVTQKITYKNTTKNADRIKYYTVTFKKDAEGNTTTEVESRTGINANGETVELTTEELSELRILETQRSNPLEFYLENNQEYEFRLLDKASNIAYKTVRVDYIENDTKILASDITYTPTTVTKDKVVATVKPYLIDMNGKNCNVEVVNNNKDANYTFTDNGKFTFQYAEVKQDKNESREVKEHTAVVDWIDKVDPTAEIQYTTSEDKSQVLVTLVNPSEDITVINNGGKTEYTFTENGSFKFEFIDKAGNKGNAIANVDWIGEEQPEDTFESTVYTISNKRISNIPNKTTVAEFKKNITTNQELVFKNSKGEVLKDSDLLGTNTTIEATGKVSKTTYTVIEKGDIDGDGKITTEDLAQLQLSYLGIQEIQGTLKQIAADMDGDGKITTEDIAQIQLILLAE